MLFIIMGILIILFTNSIYRFFSKRNKSELGMKIASILFVIGLCLIFLGAQI